MSLKRKSFWSTIISGTTLARAEVGGSNIFWLQDATGGPAYKMFRQTVIYSNPSRDVQTLSHETGHILTSDNLIEKFKNKAQEFGISLSETGTSSSKTSPDIFPRDYSKKTVYETMADIFDKIVNDPKWFNTPQRQAFRDIWLEELKKYKK